MVKEVRRPEPGGVRTTNVARLVGALRQTGPTTRDALGRLLDLSAPTVGEIVDGLVQGGVVVAAGRAPSSGGRPPMTYAINPRGLLAVGIAVGGATCTGVVCDLSGDVVTEVNDDFGHEASEAVFNRRLVELVQGLFESLDGLPQPHGVGVSVPAALDRTRREVFMLRNRPGWHGTDIGAVLAPLTGRVVVANRGHAVAVGEMLFGAGRDEPEFLGVHVGDGVGGAIIVGGEIIGLGTSAGAIGRMIPLLGDNGDEIVSERVGPGRVVDAARAWAKKERSAKRYTDFDAVVDAAAHEDPAALAAFAEAANHTARAVFNALCVTGSPVVVLSGPMLLAGPPFVDAFQDALSRLSGGHGPRVLLGQLDPRAGGAVGASALVLRQNVITPNLR